MLAKFVLFLVVPVCFGASGEGQAEPCDVLRQCLQNVVEKVVECEETLAEPPPPESENTCTNEIRAKSVQLQQAILGKKRSYFECLVEKAVQSPDRLNRRKDERCEKRAKMVLSSLPRTVTKRGIGRRGKKLLRKMRKLKAKKKASTDFDRCVRGIKQLSKQCKPLFRCCASPQICRPALAGSGLEVRRLHRELKETKIRCKTETNV